ncbi:DsrE family protein [Hydrogenophaga sp.]|uniref:DsrE family protein n=1 Tax=Hydrogenophaga sp. TaxID=1904254 RepID=UPI003D0AC0DB
MPKFLDFLKTLLFCAVLAGSLQAQAQALAQPAIKVVYHLSDGIGQATRAIGNIRNHLAADPTARIVVVTHGAGIDFLLDGAVTTSKQPFSGSIGDLAAKGVEFRVCNNTLVARNIDPSKVVLEASVVPSGVAEVARLQAREGYVYLRP